MKERLDRNFFSWTLHHFREFFFFYLGAMGCLTALQWLQSYLPEQLKLLTERIGQGNWSEISVWTFVGLAVGILVFRTCSRLLFFYPARVQQKYLRLELLSWLEKVNPRRYQKFSVGQIYQVLFDDVNNLRAFIGFGLLQVGNMIVAAFILIPKVNKADPDLWPAFIPLFSSVGIFSIAVYIFQRYTKEMFNQKGIVQNYIIETYQARPTIKNFHREKTFIEHFKKHSGKELRLFFITSLDDAFIGPMIKLGLGASLLWGAMIIRSKGGGAPDLVFFSGYLYLFLEPLMFLSWLAVVTSQGLAAWGRVKSFSNQIKIPELEEEQMKNIPLKIADNKWEFDLPYWEKQYPFSISNKKWTTIIGETGAGKSILLGRMAQFFKLKDISVVMVQQEPYLFNDTIEQNIFLGDAPNEEKRNLALEMLQLFQLESLASSLSELLKMEVGENGKRLSGGQAKRVALIRSLLSDADVILWDDPFSSVDIILERKIIQKLHESKVLKDRTVILTSHRLTTVKQSDELIYLEKDHGPEILGPIDQGLKNEQVQSFFRTQMVELPLS
jgi:ABC-type multidrug transport system fused ATPase/permease subunit